jgi:5-methylcytosine-specific restriction endonuclease McrA
MIPVASFGGVYGRVKALGKGGGFNCYDCGASLNKGNSTVDHLIPVSQRGAGGREEKGNNTDALGLLCRACNIAKSDKPMMQYLQDNPHAVEGLAKQGKQMRGKGVDHIAQQASDIADKGRKANRWTA